MSKEPVYVNLEFTPNPNSLKFSVNRELLPSGALNFTSVAQTDKAPLAKLLFAVEGVQALMVGVNFITVTKSAQGSWDVLASEVPKRMEDYLGADKAPFDTDFEPPKRKPIEGQSPTEAKIIEVLDTEIRPAVAMDGGDVIFDRYENGVVHLQLRGACSSCPSATATLKQGIETRLKEISSEIKEVVEAL